MEREFGLEDDLVVADVPGVQQEVLTEMTDVWTPELFKGGREGGIVVV